MRDLELPIGTAFDPVPEPMAYLSENCITYCNPAFSRAFPGLGPGSSLPEDWQELTGSAAGLLHRDGRDWTALTWPFQGGILLRLAPVEEQPLLPNHRLGLLSPAHHPLSRGGGPAEPVPAEQGQSPSAPAGAEFGAGCPDPGRASLRLHSL